jgi:hypothetical protein
MDNLITVISFTYPHEAHMAKGYLESNGIETFIKDEYTVQVNNFYSNAVGGVKLLTKESDYDKSIQLLKDVDYIKDKNLKNNYKIEIQKINIETNKTICPYCKSENIRRNKNINIWLVPIYIILGTIFPIYKLSYKCFDCDKEWKYKK